MEYSDYKLLLHINKHALDDALEVHAQHQADISEITAALNAKQAESKEALGAVEARLLQDYRSGGDKMTSDEIKAAITRSADRRAAWKAYQALKEEHERWAGLLAAWQQRGYAIKALGDLYSHNYFSITSVSSHKETTLRSDDLRERMRAASASEPGRIARVRVK